MQAELIARRTLRQPERPHRGAPHGALAQLMNGAPRSRELKQLATAMNSRAGGLPDSLRAGIENLSGVSMDGVRVHYNSSRPAQLSALAYAQGSEIHVAPGQEKHLPHEAWHVVQQAQGRVRPTTLLADRVPVNDDRGLESEADAMGSRALAHGSESRSVSGKPVLPSQTAQRQESAPRSGADAGPALLALIDKLQAAADTADKKAAKNRTASPAPDMAPRLKDIRALAHGQDQAAKAQALAALRAEMGEAGPAPPLEAPALQPVVQRVKPMVLVGGGLAVLGLGYLIKRTYEYIRDRREDAILTTVHEPDEHLPNELTAGIAALPGAAAKAARLFRNVNNFRFRYTGDFIPAVFAISAHQGDCRTLVGIYKLVADAMDIPFAWGSLFGRLLVAPIPIHGRSARSNTDPRGLPAWSFVEHLWAIGAGTPYDLLFMVTPPPHAAVGAPSVHDEVTYYTFAGGSSIILPGEAALPTPIGGQGRVFATVADAETFIDANTAGAAH